MSRKAFSVGVDLGGTNVRAGLVSQGKIIKLQAQSIRSQGTEREVFEDVFAVIDQVMDKRVHSLGIGVPSLVNPTDGTIFDTVNIPSWKHVPLKKRLERRYKIPVRIDNDANCFALGEKTFGMAKECDNFVGLIVGTGLGAGVIAKGSLYSGVDCGAGEFGMIPYRDSILEHYASGQFFRRNGFDGAKLAAEQKLGSKKAQKIFDEFGYHLAQAIKVILYALAPEMIVLGGSVGRALPAYEFALRRGLDDFGYPAVAKKLKIKVSRLKEVAVLGAASL
jgi:glucokinase